MSNHSLISARYLLPIRPRGKVLDSHSVVLCDRKIVEILATDTARNLYPEAPETLLPHHVLMPGLINMHTHSPMSLLRGYADDMAMQAWLQEKIWPVESQFLSGQFVADGTRLAIAEMLRGGTTCFNEQYFFPEEIIDVVNKTGIRASVGLAVIDFPNPWTQSARECLDIAERLLRSERCHERISFTLAPHAPYSVGDESFGQIARISNEWDIPINLHLLETTYDLQHSMETYSEAPLQRLKRLGLLNEKMLAVHMTQLDSNDIALVSKHGVHVIHCPRSNLKLASGFCPVSALVEAGVNVSIGTDGAASNNRLDVLMESQIASLLAKGLSQDASSIDALSSLEMITINAARALGQSETLGSIEPGKWADLAALDLHHPETQPLHCVISQLAYAACSRQFSHVWVGGEPLLANGRLTRMDLDEVLHQAEVWRERIAREVKPLAETITRQQGMADAKH